MHSFRFLQLWAAARVSAQISNTPPPETFSAVEWPLQTFKTVNILIPQVHVLKSGKTEPGLLFTTIRNVTNSHFAPYITSDDGQLVWYGEVATGITALRTQTLDGRPVLTYCKGHPAGVGIGYGTIVVLNSTYDMIYEVTLNNTSGLSYVATTETAPPSFIDIHENELTENGGVLVTAINVTQTDLTSVNGPEHGWILDSQLLELDVKTSEVLFHWSPWEQSGMPLNASWGPMDEYSSGTNKSTAWDWSHLNSAAKYGDKYLINSRHLCTVFLVDKDGKVEWRLNASYTCPLHHAGN